MKSEFQRHKKSDAIKWVAVFVAIILLGIAVAAAMTAGFKDANPYGWFKSDKPNAEVTQTSEDPISADIVNSEGISLAFTSSAVAAADGAYVEKTLVATIQPIDAVNKTVDWFVSWFDGSDSSDVSEYLTITPSADTLTCSVKCYKAFSKDIEIKVVTRDGGFTASCIVIYVGHPSSIDISNTSVSPSGGFYSLLTNKNYNFNVDMTNIFGQVGGTELVLEQSAVGSLYFGDQINSYSGSMYWDNIELKSLASLFDEFLTVSLTGTQLTVAVADKLVESYYSSFETNELRQRIYRGRYLSYSASDSTNLEKMQYNVDNLLNSHFVVKVTERSTGLSASIKIKLTSSVSSVSVSLPTITF